jgi:hypothetical protein
MMIQGGQASPMKNWGCIDHAKKVAGNRGADMGYIPTYGGYIYIYTYIQLLLVIIVKPWLHPQVTST